MKSITIRLADDVAEWARREASKRDKSLSRFVADLIAAEMTRASDYEAAMRSYLSREPYAFRRHKGPYPRQEDLYDRPGSR